jgi:hypothetical protein
LDSQAQRLLSTVTATAAIDVAEQKKRREIETQDRETLTRQSVAKAKAEATLAENEQRRREAESKMQYETAKAAFDRDEQKAKLESKLLAERRGIELQIENELMKRDQEEASRRAADLAAATVNAESVVRQAQGEASRDVEIAKGEALKLQELAAGEAAASIRRAEAYARATELKATADLFASLKEAEGKRAMLEAEAAGLEKIYQATLVNPDFAKLQRTLDSHQPVAIADAAAKGLQNLSPKLSYFVQGGADTANDPLAPLRKLGIGVLPAVRAYAQQLGISIPGDHDPQPSPSPSSSPSPSAK